MDRTGKKWDQLQWRSTSDKYRQRIIRLYGTTRIFGQLRPTPLNDIYTDLYLLEQPTAFRRFDIHQLRQDPDLPNKAERVRGSIFLRTPAAHRLYILGKPGAGKTTFLKHLALEAARGQLDKVPIFVTLKEWADSGEDLLPFIHCQFEICGFPDAESFVKHLLEQTDYALLLFDGLDEIQQEGDRRARAVAALRDFSRQYDRAQCLITCRLAATDYTFQRFHYVKVAGFAPNQMKRFVRNWFSATPDTAQLFLDDIAKEEHCGLRELARTPLLLALLCLGFQDTKCFPKSHADVYSDALDTLLCQWHEDRQVSHDDIYRNLSLERKHQLYAAIAHETFDNGDQLFQQHRLQSQIAAFLASLPDTRPTKAADIHARNVLSAIEAQHGIFVERAHRMHSFAHSSFQEYYAAHYIAANENRGTLPPLLSHCTDPRWREVILLTASLLDNADQFFIDFRLALDAILAEDENLQAFLRWSVEKSASVQAGAKPAALRSFYIYIGLATFSPPPGGHGHDRELAIARGLDRVFAIDRELDRELGLDLARAGARDRTLVRVLDRDLAVARIRARALAPDLALALVLAVARDCDRAIDRNPALAPILVLDLRAARNIALDLSKELGAVELHEELSSLALPAVDSPAAGYERFASDLQATMITHHNIGHNWSFTKYQLDRLANYLQATHHLLQCLDLATVTNRHAIENTLLLPPGDWSEDDILNPEEPSSLSE